MFPHLEERRSDSRFVERVWRTASEREGAFTSISTVHWSIVVATLDGRVSVSLHGPETVATRKEHPPEMAWFGIVRARRRRSSGTEHRRSTRSSRPATATSRISRDR